MTKQEATVIEMYTGVCMLAGDDRKYFYEYAEKLLGHPIMTHEYLEYAKRLKELSKPDFLKICESAKNDGWIPVTERLPEDDSTKRYIVTDTDGHVWSSIWYGYAEEENKTPCFYCWDDDMWQCYKPDVIAWRPLPEPYRPEQAAAQRPEWKDRMLHTFLGGHT